MTAERDDVVIFERFVAPFFLTVEYRILSDFIMEFVSFYFIESTEEKFIRSGV